MGNTPQLAGDICRNKHKGNPQSELAFMSIRKRVDGDCRRIYEYILTRGDSGATSKEVRDALKMNYTTVSARMSNLKEMPDGIYEDKESPRRDGCWVCKPKAFAGR